EHVDKSWRNREPPRIDHFFGGGIVKIADANNMIAADRDIDCASFASPTIINSATFNKKVELGARRRRFHSTSWRCHITQSYDGTEKGVTPRNHLSNLSWPIQSAHRFRAHICRAHGRRFHRLADAESISGRHLPAPAKPHPSRRKSTAGRFPF